MLFLSSKFFSKFVIRKLPRVFLYPLPIVKLLFFSSKWRKIHEVNVSYDITSNGKIFNFDKWQLKMVVGYLECQGLPNWNIHCSDGEIIVSLHRWGWLLTQFCFDGTPKDKEKALLLLRDWSAKVKYVKNDLVWESYSTGERICNAILFLSLFETGSIYELKLPKFLAEVINNMAMILLWNLEYYGINNFGNHIINNARALYFAGNILKRSKFIAISKKIIKLHLNKIVLDDGFMREGSSHYQFLFTRWMMELLSLARMAKDWETVVFLLPIVSKMLKCCWFFIVKTCSGEGSYEIPLFGDVSPDFPWQWLLDMLWSRNALNCYTPALDYRKPKISGWGELFGCGVFDLTGVAKKQYCEFISFKDSGWYRLNYGDITVFWHVEPQAVPNFPSHAHCDIGSFVLYIKGQMVFADPGRLNYELHNQLGRHGVSAKSHNSVIIDNLESFDYHNRSRVPSFYVDKNVVVDFVAKENCFMFSIEYAGFSYKGDCKIKHKRQFLIFQNHLIIEDILCGKGSHVVSTYFQCAHDLRIVKHKDMLSFYPKANNLIMYFSKERSDTSSVITEILRGKIAPEIGGWFWPNYGEQKLSTTIVFSEENKFPFKNIYKLSWHKR